MEATIKEFCSVQSLVLILCGNGHEILNERISFLQTALPPMATTFFRPDFRCKDILNHVPLKRGRPS